MAGCHGERSASGAAAAPVVHPSPQGQAQRVGRVAVRRRPGLSELSPCPFLSPLVGAALLAHNEHIVESYPPCPGNMAYTYYTRRYAICGSRQDTSHSRQQNFHLARLRLLASEPHPNIICIHSFSRTSSMLQAAEQQWLGFPLRTACLMCVCSIISRVQCPSEEYHGPTNEKE
jgi:hypothetical protein